MKFEETRIVLTTRTATFAPASNCNIKILVTHSTQKPHVVAWSASTGGLLLGNLANGKVISMADDPTAAIEEAERRALAAAELLARLAEIGGDRGE